MHRLRKCLFTLVQQNHFGITICVDSDARHKSLVFPKRGTYRREIDDIACIRVFDSIGLPMNVH